MRELELYEQYLVRYRQERLQLSHQTLVASEPDWAEKARLYAAQAEVADRMRAAIKTLGVDPGKFIQEYLQS